MLVDKNKKIGICTPSWSGPGEYPHVFQYGVKKIKDIMEMDVIYSEHALDKGFVGYKDRAGDINELFANQDVGFICSSIGGDDSVNIIPFLDLDIIRNNPKPMMGFSDTTTLLLYLKINCNTPTIYGPSIMSGFSEPSGISVDMIKQMKDLFFTDINTYVYRGYDQYIEGYNQWDNIDKFLDSKPPVKKYEGWNVLNSRNIKGEIYGGCLEVIKIMKDRKIFPEDANFWNSKILFLETSEQVPTLEYIIKELTDYHDRGILSKITGLIFGQFTYYSNEDKEKINDGIKNFILDDLNYKNMLLVTNLNFGHVRPQWPLLMGSVIEIDTELRQFKLIL